MDRSRLVRHDVAKQRNQTWIRAGAERAWAEVPQRFVVPGQLEMATPQIFFGERVIDWAAIVPDLQRAFGFLRVAFRFLMHYRLDRGDDRPRIVAGERLDCGPEVAVVEMLHQVDDVAALGAGAAIS